MRKDQSIFKDKEYLGYSSIGTMPQRSYYIPFLENETFVFKDKILDRTASSCFISLDGEWKFQDYSDFNQVDINGVLKKTIDVPSCVQMRGYDQIQYLNARYPFFYDPPYIPNKTPAFHYRRSFEITDLTFKYYLNFEGVDCGFYVFINGKKIGYGQISHCTNEFDITPYVTAGENLIDVVVFKWTASTYLECQDKFRWTGIFRNVYILKRPEKHITDYKITTSIIGSDGIIEIENLSDVEIRCCVNQFDSVLKVGEKIDLTIKNAQFWTSCTPYLYDVVLYACGEKILNKVGIRTSEIKGGIFLINGKHEKLKGVNRHEFSCENGATVTVSETLNDIMLIKQMNANAVRTSHYPDIPEFYDICDAYGLYVIDEADLETHGMFSVENSLGFDLMYDLVNSDTFNQAVLNREIAMLERDKNRTCVIIWSLGNECCFGSMFFDGIEYIKNHDSRPIHYQGVETIENKEDYYTDKIDIVGRFYPPLEFFDKYLADDKEKRPLLLSEYLHAMGNSCGGLKDYWEKINSSDRIMGAFVWEFCDHAIKTNKGFLYGGDFGESEHDGNFCVDGLLTPDRKIKSNYFEVQAMYGNLSYLEPESVICKFPPAANDIAATLELNDEGQLLSLNETQLISPIKINILRAYLDNDVHQKSEWQLYENYAMQTYNAYKQGNEYRYIGKIVANTLKPIMDYSLTYKAIRGGVEIGLEYTVNEYVSFLPRIGLEFAIDGTFQEFKYKGYGETESYVDKHISSKYGEYISTAERNYSRYIKPQECGSHYGTTELEIKDFAKITAKTPFSFSVLPYSTKELMTAKHDFELAASGKTWINLDISMSGVGTASCGPMLPEKYRASKKSVNVFRIVSKIC